MMAKFSALPGHSRLQSPDKLGTGTCLQVTRWVGAGAGEPQLRDLVPAGGLEPNESV